MPSRSVLARIRHQGRRWGLAVFVLLGVAGGGAGAAIALLTVPKNVTLISLFGVFVGAAAVGGGVVVGWLVAALILSAAPGRIHCPRCGEPNDVTSGSCSACGLPLGVG